MNSSMNNAYGQGMPQGIPRFTQQPPGRMTADEIRQRQRGQRDPRTPLSVQQQQRAQPPQQPAGQGRGRGNPGNFSRPPRQTPQSPQWPLQAAANSPTSPYNPAMRGPPPQRPPRPSGPSIPDRAAQYNDRRMMNPPQPQYTQPSPTAASSMYSGTSGWNDDYYSQESPILSRPLTGGSLASTNSGYSVPDMPPPIPPQALPPLPQQYQQSRGAQPIPMPAVFSRARAPLGPPPSARRGPPSYYPPQNHAHVTPIIEESDSARSARGSLKPGGDSRGSYASSNAIPIGVPDYYLHESGNPRYQRRTTDSLVSDYEEQYMDMPPRMSEISRQDSPPALVRQASMGKRSKPTLTTIKSGDPSRNAPMHQRTYSAGSSEDDTMQTLPPSRAMAPPLETAETFNRSVASEETKGNLSRRTGSSGPLGMSQSSFLERSSFDSEKSDLAASKSKEYLYEPMPDRDSRQATVNSVDPRVEAILNRLEKGGAISHMRDTYDDDYDQLDSPASRAGPKRPPRLDIELVREAEQRGSLTSLPDLIRRATRLASNLDRGKTASRLGFDWMLPEDKGMEKSMVVDAEKRRPSSLSDMISSFPPPAVNASQPVRGSGRFVWPSSDRNATDRRVGQSRGRQPRRVCGLPIWAFFLLLILLIVLIAAAIIIPVVLIVIPRQQQLQARSLSACENRLSCQNGGTNVVGTDGSCRCLCINGYSGSTCDTGIGSNCTGTAVAGATNATAGDSLPRLFSASKANFSIVLDGAQVLSLFSATNLSCASENSLVTFRGLSKRSADEFLLLPTLPLIGDSGELQPTKTLDQRQATAVTSEAAATSNGIVYAVGSAPGAAATISPNATTTLDLDFARVAVLLVLQDSGQLSDAVAAQSAFQRWFSGQSAPGITSTNITLSNGYSANLSKHQVVVKNGTSIGES